MIKQLKTGMKLLRYTFGFKMCMFWIILFIALGVLMYRGRGVGSFFIVVSGLWVVQLMYSLNVSNMIQTSPLGKAFQTSATTIISFITFLLLYLLDVVLMLLMKEGQELYMIVQWLISDGVIIFLLMLYCGFAYKFYIASTVFFFIAFFSIIDSGCFVSGRPVFHSFIHVPFDDISWIQAFIIGLIFIIAGALVQYVASCFVYKYPLAKSGQLKGLQKIM